MANLQFDQTTMHTGVIIPGHKVTVDDVTGRATVTEGAIIDLETDTRGLKAVAPSLVDRGMAHYTNSPATHTLALVTPSQEAMPKDAPAGVGTAPVADSVRENMAAQHRLAMEKEAAARQQMGQVAAQEVGRTVATPQEVHNPVAPAPVDVSTQQPTEEEVAATAATVK